MGNSHHRQMGIHENPKVIDLTSLTKTLKSGGKINEKTQRKALFAAVESNQIDFLHSLIKFGVNVNLHRAKDGFTPLHIAAGSYLPNVAAVLIEAGADPSKCDMLGRTPIWVAARMGATKILEVLLASSKASSAVNKTDKSGRSPLMTAASRAHRNAELAAVLLKSGSKTKLTDKDGRCVAHIAAIVGDDEVLAEVLQVAPDLAFSRDNRQNTPLHLATERGQLSCVSLLLRTGGAARGVNMTNEKKRTALWLASERGEANLVATLIRGGADTTIVDRQGWGALRAAVYSLSADTVETLLTAGTDVSVQCSAGITPLHSAAFYDCIGEVTKLLLQHKASTLTRDKKGKTPLFVAIEVGNTTAASILLKNGACPKARNNKGKTILQKSKGGDCEKVIRNAISGVRLGGAAPPQMTSRQPSAMGSTGSTGDSFTSDDRLSEDLSQRLGFSRVSVTSSCQRASTISGLVRSLRKPKAKMVSGRSCLPAKLPANTGQPSSVQCCAVGTKMSKLHLHGCAVLEVDDGALRCETRLYARILDASHDNLTELIFNNDLNLPASSQLGSKPLEIDIPGSPGYLLKPARLLLRAAKEMPGTDLRVFRKSHRGWEEIEIAEHESLMNENRLWVETDYLGIFVVLFCATRSVHTVTAAPVELFGGISVMTSGDEGVGVVCEMEPPVDDIERRIDSEINEDFKSPYAMVMDKVIKTTSDSQSSVFFLRLLDPNQPLAKLNFNLPAGFALGTVTTDPNIFQRVEPNMITLTSGVRRAFCVWRTTKRETSIQVERFHQMPLRLFVKLIQNSKKFTLKVSVQDDDDARELVCSESEKVDITSGGLVEMANMQVCVNRGLMPLEIPLRVKEVPSNAPGAALADNGHILIRASKRAITIPFSLPSRS